MISRLGVGRRMAFLPPKASAAYAESNVSDVDMTQGMTYYDIPAEYKARDTQYTVINGKPVLVDSQTHKVVRMAP